MNQEPLPQIHLIRDTDLSVFAYELHIFAGDFLRECEFNMRSLATNTGADSIAIMGKNHIWLSDALFAYCSTADLYQMISTTEFKLHSIQDSKRQLYEQYALGEIDLETYRERKAVYDAELVQAKNVHAAITAQTKQIQSDYEARLKQREIVQEVDSAGTLTQALIDRLINKVYIFPGDRIEIEYVTQDFLATAEP